MESSDHHYIRSRVSNACDSCKARKVKCDGKLPCSYCTRRHRAETCHYSPQLKRRHTRRSSGVQQLPRSPPVPGQEPGAEISSQQQEQQRSSRQGSRPQSQTPKASTRGWGHDDEPASRHDGGASTGTHDTDGDEEAEVPREARLLCDAQGKLIFIGDCAPLSFFQSVRQLITTRVDENALSPNSSRYSVLENAPSKQHFFPSRGSGSRGGAPDPLLDTIPAAVSRYFAATAGLVDLFENTNLTQAVTSWAKHSSSTNSSSNTSAVYYLVLAIGHQDTDESPSQDYFEHARNIAFQNLSENLGIGTVQAYVLITLFMLRACQINGAFLFFGIAVRAAFSIGVHRTEVNQRFGPQMLRQRDRLWISLRVVDLFLSTNMGRPPAASDIDCTVSYRTVDGATGQETSDMLSASVQIFLIMETLVIEVYSRRKISLQLTEGLSSQLRDWSSRWLPQIKELMTATTASSETGGTGSSTATTTPTPAGHAGSMNHSSSTDQHQVQVCAATQVLASYYYAVILVSRPFLMFEVHRRLGDGPGVSRSAQQQAFSGKSKLADACVDAACLMVELVSDGIERGLMPVKMPLLVSWLFAASLTLGLGLIGNFGRILERYSRTSIHVLEYFAQTDAHAMQYSLIARSLLDAALAFLEKKDMAERLQRTQSSAQLFGLMPSEKNKTTPGGAGDGQSPGLQHRGSADSGLPMFGGGAGVSTPSSAHMSGGTSRGAVRGLFSSMTSPFGGVSAGLGLNNGSSSGGGGSGGPMGGNSSSSNDNDMGDTSSLLGGIDAEAGFLSLSGLVPGNNMGGSGNTGPGGSGSTSLGVSNLSVADDADTFSFDPLLFGGGGGIGGEGGDAIHQSFNLFPLLEASGDIDLAHYF